MNKRRLDAVLFNQVSEREGFPKLRILDLSCGDAILLSRFAAEGCHCVGTRYREGDYILSGQPVADGVEIIDGVDLLERLPFGDAEFDVVILQEVVEHLPALDSLLSEVSRVLKVGGSLLLTTPNIHRLHSRLHFFLTGAHKLIRRRVGWDLAVSDMYAYHQNPIDFPILHTQLYQRNLQIQALGSTRVKWRSYPLLLLWPLIRLACVFEYRPGGSRGSESPEGERDLLRWMTSFPLLYCEQIALQATRRPNNAPAQGIIEK